MMKALAVAVLTSLLASPLAGQERPRDGNWWTSLPLQGPPGQLAENMLIKSWYVTGMIEGSLGLGHGLAIATAVEAQDEAGAEKAEANYRAAADRYLTNITQAQVIDGLTAFYRDFRNRSILVAIAVEVVLRQIAGEPKDRIDQMVETLRKNAAG